MTVVPVFLPAARRLKESRGSRTPPPAGSGTATATSSTPSTSLPTPGPPPSPRHNVSPTSPREAAAAARRDEVPAPPPPSSSSQTPPSPPPQQRPNPQVARQPGRPGRGLLRLSWRRRRWRRRSPRTSARDDPESRAPGRAGWREEPGSRRKRWGTGPPRPRSGTLASDRGVLEILGND